MKIDREKSVSIDIVIYLLGLAAACGILFQRVEGVREDMAEVKRQVGALYEHVFPDVGRTANK